MYNQSPFIFMLRLKNKEMKILCDVCDREEASVFCPSDEAALCSACDRHVHRANKLAVKHTRFSILRSAAEAADAPPLCDICQIRRAFLFCQEDRAILCRECDIPIHCANEHTKKHCRFLLTGVKISPPLATPCSSVDGGEEKVGCSRKRGKLMGSSNGLVGGPLMENPEVEDNGALFTRSSISEYLESLPGWCVEEFLDSSCATDVLL